MASQPIRTLGTTGISPRTFIDSFRGPSVSYRVVVRAHSPANPLTADARLTLPSRFQECSHSQRSCLRRWTRLNHPVLLHSDTEHLRMASGERVSFARTDFNVILDSFPGWDRIDWATTAFVTTTLMFQAPSLSFVPKS
jgi:hypothetical protein